MKKADKNFFITALLLTFMLTKTLNAMQDTKEIWKDIQGYSGHQVSNLGQVKSIDHYIKFHNVKTRSISERLKKGRIRVLDINKYGYYMVRLKSKGKYHSVHRLVCEAFLPNPNNLPSINHKNGIKTDNRVENLEWCTVQYNNVHAFKNGLRSNYWGANAHLNKI